MDKPFISIIIPALNEEHFLPNLLESLTQQTDTNFEVIVVDGRSKDKTVEKAKTFEKRLKNLSVIVADHAGLPYQRNLGARRGAGDWYLFVDADSVLLPYSIERVRANIVSRDLQFFASWNKPDTESANDAVLSNFYNLLLDGSLTMKIPAGTGPFTGVKKDIFEKVHGYDEEHPFLEDADFRNRLGKIGVHISIIRETLFVWSLRRMRKQGFVKVMRSYMKAVVPYIFFKTVPRGMKGYDMGGHEFTKKCKKSNQSFPKKLISDMKKFIREVVE